MIVRDENSNARDRGVSISAVAHGIALCIVID
jgi:hypothetical protein